MNQRTDRRIIHLLALLGAVALLAGCASHRYEDRYGHDRSYHVDETVYGSGGFSVGASYHRSSWYDPFWSPGYSFGYGYGHAPTYFIYRDYYPRYHDRYWNRPSWRHHGRSVWFAPRHPWYGNRRPHSRSSALPTADHTAGEATRLSRQPPARNRGVRSSAHPGNDPRIIRRAKETDPVAGESTRLRRPSTTPSRSTPTVRNRQSRSAPVIRHSPRVSEPADRAGGQSRTRAERPVIHRQTRPEPRAVRPSVDARPTVRDTRTFRSRSQPRQQSTRPQARPTPTQRPVQTRSAPTQRPVRSRATPVQRPVQQRSAPTQRPVQRRSAPAPRPSPPPTIRSRSSDDSDNRSSRRR